MTREILVLALGASVVAVSVARGGKAQELAPAPVAVKTSKRIWAEGRLAARPGSEVVLAPDSCGVLADLVGERAAVKKGDVVARLAPDEPEAALREAEARLLEARAPLAFLAKEAARAEKLEAAGLLSEQNLTKARHDLEMANVRREAAQAVREHAAVALAHTRIVAPIDGVVVARFAHAGETVVSGKPIVRIVDLASARVEAEIDEFDAPGLALGASATVSAEGHAAKWSARVEEIPDVVVARSLEREGPGEPQGTRVVLAKVALDSPAPLRLGQRVEIEIEVAPAPPAEAPRLAPEPSREPPVVAAHLTVSASDLTPPRPGEGDVVSAASTGLTVLGSLLTVGALWSSRRRGSALAGKRLVRLSDEGILGDQDLVLEARSAGRGRARVQLGAGTLDLFARNEPGVEVEARGIDVAIEGVPVVGRTAIVHGMVLEVGGSENPARYVYLDRAPSPGEQDRQWVELSQEGVTEFCPAEGDSIADVWSEDEIIVLDESEEGALPPAPAKEQKARGRRGLAP